MRIHATTPHDGLEDGQSEETEERKHLSMIDTTPKQDTSQLNGNSTLTAPRWLISSTAHLAAISTHYLCDGRSGRSTEVVGAAACAPPGGEC